MDDALFQNLRRLEALSQMGFGLEAFSTAIKIQDLWTHYTTRFLRNVQAIFKDFSRSELDRYVHRYQRQLTQTLGNDQLSLGQLLIAIPKGMQGSYLTTLQVLQIILQEIKSATLSDDLQTLTAQIETGQTAPSSGLLSKAQFDKLTKQIGALYRTNGVTQTSGSQALDSMADTKTTLQLLETIGTTVYPQVIALQKQVVELDTVTHTLSFSKTQEDQLVPQILSLAYRLSLFAVVMDHIQTMEHAFIKALQVLQARHAHT